MPSYNFKKETKLYIVTSEGYSYAVQILPDFSVSQTFSESEVKVRTLHEPQKLFDDAVITKANPANFNFTVPLIYETSNSFIFKLVRDLTSSYSLNNFDLYIGGAAGLFKLEKAVLETATFQINRNSLLTLALAGTARKLTPFNGAVPGITASLTTGSTYVIPNAVEIMLDSSVKTNIVGVTLELTNKVTWLDFTTLQDSINASSYSGTMYPQEYVLEGRTLSGNIQQYITNLNIDNVNNWANHIPLRIRTGDSSSKWLLDVNIPSIVFTNRLEVQDIYTQSYDFRMTSSPTDMSSVISYLTLDQNLGQHTAIWAAI